MAYRVFCGLSFSLYPTTMWPLQRFQSRRHTHLHSQRPLKPTCLLLWSQSVRWFFFIFKKTPSCAIHHVVFCCLTFIFFTDPVVVDLSQLEYGIVTSYTYTITNHGLIAANDTTLQLPTNHPFLKFSWTNPGEVAANSTAVVLVQVTGGHARRRRTTSSCYVGLAGMNYSELIRIIHFTEVTI